MIDHTSVYLEFLKYFFYFTRIWMFNWNVSSFLQKKSYIIELVENIINVASISRSQSCQSDYLYCILLKLTLKWDILVKWQMPRINSSFIEWTNYVIICNKFATIQNSFKYKKHMLKLINKIIWISNISFLIELMIVFIRLLW